MRTIPFPPVARFLSFAAACAFQTGRGFDLRIATGPDDVRANVVVLHFIADRLRRSSWNHPVGRGAAASAHSWLYATVVSGMERYALRARADLRRVVCVSQSVANDAIRLYGVDGSLISVVPNGVDALAFAPADQETSIRARLKLGLPQDRFIVSFVGGDWPRKGVPRLMQAWTGLPKDFLLLLVGRGVLPPGTDPRILHLQPTTDVAMIYAASDAFAMPSYYEPFGLAALEAMASGLPTILSSSTGLAEYCQDRRDALILKEPFGGDEVRKLLLELASNDTLRAQLAEAARATALDLSWDRSATSFEEALTGI